MSEINNNSLLTPAADFQRSGRCPVDLRWLIFNQRESLQETGALIRFGKRRWLVDEMRLLGWIRENGENFSAVRRKSKKHVKLEKLSEDER